MIYILAILILGLGWWMPWWFSGLVSFAVGFKAKSFANAFLVGFIGVGGIWVAIAYYSDLKSLGLMSQRMSGLFQLPFPELMYLMTLLIGGLFGGLWAMAGRSLSRIR